ncbi:MAG TPA: hypothetical protein PKV66_01080 [Candidatus Pelethenecus sp.]|nr:hypothetical protein [Candidatus Pelethenecus sp.]
MAWEQISVLIAGIIGSVGGAGAIIVAVTKWFGNFMSEKLFEQAKNH